MVSDGIILRKQIEEKNKRLEHKLDILAEAVDATNSGLHIKYSIEQNEPDKNGAIGIFATVPDNLYDGLKKQIESKKSFLKDIAFITKSENLKVDGKYTNVIKFSIPRDNGYIVANDDEIVKLIAHMIKNAVVHTAENKANLIDDFSKGNFSKAEETNTSRTTSSKYKIPTVSQIVI